MVRITSLSILRWNEDTPEPIILDLATDLSEYNFLFRGSVSETIKFASRMVARRGPVGVCQVEHEGQMMHALKTREGLCIVAAVDPTYPLRVSVNMMRELVDGFAAAHAGKWRSCEEDMTLDFAPLRSALEKYQKPEEADKFMKVRGALDDTKGVLVQTIDELLERGEKLDDLLEKSKDLSDSSKRFYKEARKTNSCCTIA